MEKSKQTFMRKMSAKHLIMLSLGGVIGTGIFLSTGYLIQTAGAIGTIIAYVIGAILVSLVMLCLGELSVYEPSTSSFHNYATKYISPGAGFVVAWLYWLTWTVALGSQFITMAILMQRWFPKVETWIWCLIFVSIILLSNIIDVRWFSVSEFWMSLIKVLALTIFLILGTGGIFGFLPISPSGSAPLFQEFTANGTFPKGIGAVFLAILSANFAFSGTELIGVAAGETENPKKNIPKAIIKTITILVVLFIGTIIIIGALLPQSSATLTESPFISILNTLGVPYAADIMNFILISAILSGANSGLYAASRMLWSLANVGTLPKKFAKLTKRGLPIYGLLLTILGGFLSLFSSIYAADTVYLVLVSISGFAVVVVWLSIGWSQLNFRKQYLKSGQSVADLGYQTPMYPIVPWLVIILCAISMIGIAFDPNQRVALLIGIPFLIICYAYYELIFKKKIADSQIDETNDVKQEEKV
ncbi:amino acid permease [Enterococcus sp. AZ177]|uniref:amino acid permease n=1 Tax=unclassified Enterococcus TaxID=2608891 RepID=UPI003D2FBDDD